MYQLIFLILVSRVKKSEVHDVEKPKLSRYDNFLKSGSKIKFHIQLILNFIRVHISDARPKKFSSETKTKRTVPSATITKEDYLKNCGKTNGK